MDEYQLGKDIGSILARLDMLEKRRSGCDCHGKSGGRSQMPIPIAFSSNTKANKELGILLSTIGWSFGDNTLSDCELQSGGSLTLFDDGHFRAIGSVKCNTGGIDSCKSLIVSVAFFTGSAPNYVNVGQYDATSTQLGPGSSQPFQSDQTDGNLKTLYSQITAASLWVRHCETGV